MNVAIISLTGKGAQLGIKISELLGKAGHQTDMFSVPEAARGVPGVVPMKTTLRATVGDIFYRYGGLVMIMAMGIVVRTLAPYIRDKRTDPAVVTLDEGGNFVISVLSGHVGGANDLARQLAAGLGAQAVITTATDVNGAPAADVLARDLKLQPESPEAVKKVNAALARGESIYLYTQYSLPLPESDQICVRPWDRLDEHVPGWRVLITGMINIKAGDRDLLLRPRNIVVGVGCRRGAACGDIIGEIKKSLDAVGRSLQCVKSIATIVNKTSEEGLVKASREMGVPLRGFGPGEINSVMEVHGLAKSEFVMLKMGVGGVCEPAAMLACRKGRLLAPKIKNSGITVALAEEESGWWD
ncbi:MAG: hypothetical protein VR68_14590 [Peptococcaceae bacterium BRH_c4a]|nr:MAG: hypothetical protein VR68_14590 [Peptococcaceae bacterium BRH_c4a]